MKCLKMDELAFQKRTSDEVATMFDYKDLASSAKIQAVRVFPGAPGAPHKHVLRTEVLQIIGGTGDIVVNGEVAASNPGELVLVEPAEVHQVVNRGEDVFTVVVFRVNDQGDDDIVWLEEADNER